MRTPPRARVIILLLCAVLMLPSATPGQTQTTAPAQAPASAAPLSMSALAQQVTSLFPVLEGEVIDVSGPTLTLAVPRATGARPGLALEVFREGREIKHPRTGQVLGKAEQAIGRAVVTEVFEGYSLARLDGPAGEGARQGDRVRTPGGKIRITLLALTAPGMKQNLVEAVTNEVYEGLTRTGKFQVMLGDQIAVWLAQQKIGAEDFLQGRGVPEASERFKADNIVVVHLQQVQRKPFMDVRVFVSRRPEAAVTSASFVPASIRPVQAGNFSGADRVQPVPERKPRSLLARLLGGDLEAGTYSTGESSIPLREVAKFPFIVSSMDVAVSPSDGIPRLLVTDGERVYLYKVVNRALEPEWTHYARSLGRVISVQLAELTGDHILEAVVNRFDTKIGMSSFIVALKNGKPVTLVDTIDGFLYAVDEKGTGVKQTLWLQRYREETFFGKGHADQMSVRNGTLVKERPAIVPDNFRATGATFSNIMGKDSRALIYIDEQNRLRIANGTEEVWRSSSIVGGGGGGKIEVQRYIERGGRSFFYTMEPAPLSVDLDGDGIQEIIVPQNQIEGGVLAVVFKGPAGVRLQQVNSGFEGIIVGMGAIPGEDGGPPTLIAGVTRFRNMFKTSGETQIIMTTQE